MGKGTTSGEIFRREILAEVKNLKRTRGGGWLVAAGLATGLAICTIPVLMVRDADAHGTRASIRRGSILPENCDGSELFIHDIAGPVLKVSDPASCSGVAVWEVATMDEVVDEWAVYVSSYFDQRIKLTVTGGATNTLVIEEAVFVNGELELNLVGRRMRITSPSSIDLSAIEASGNPPDDALPFDYLVWIEETGGPGACAEGSLDCAVLGGTRNTVTALEYATNALIAIPIVQTPATVGTDGPLLLDPLFHALPSAGSHVQDTAKTGGGLSPATQVAVGGGGTSLMTVNEIAWVTVHGLQVVPAFDMATEPAYLLDSLANADLQEPFDEVNTMAGITEQLDGTLFGTTDYFHLAVYQFVYELSSTSYSRVFLNPPTCTYAANQLTDARLDINNCSNFKKPAGFSGLVFIGRLLVKNDTDLIDTIDTPSVATQSGTGGDLVGPASALNGNAAVFDGTGGHLVKDSGTPYPPLMMDIRRATDQLLLGGISQFIDWDLEIIDDDDWFPGADSKHVEFGFPGRVKCDLSLRADVDPAGSPKELCVRAYIDDVLPPGVEYACFLTSDDMDTAAGAIALFEVIPGFDISFEILGTADLAMRATLVCERKR